MAILGFVGGLTLKVVSRLRFYPDFFTSFDIWGYPHYDKTCCGFDDFSLLICLLLFIFHFGRQIPGTLLDNSKTATICIWDLQARAKRFACQINRICKLELIGFANLIEHFLPGIAATPMGFTKIKNLSEG